MNEEEKQQLLQELLRTEEGAALLAQSMVEPIRCGGCEYENDRMVIWLGGKKYDYEAFYDAYEANNHQYPREWMKTNSIG